MRKLKRAAALVLALVMAVSLFMSAGRLVTVAEAESASISTAYPEATELLTNLGIMNNAEKTWAEAITAEEANSIIKTAFFDAPFNPYSWGYSTAIPEGTVTGAAFLQSIINSSGVGWSADQASWTTYFHLTRGIPGYDASAALSREQAAQLLVNSMKAQPNYTSNSEIRGALMGVNYVKVSTDEMGRPSYQWVRTADGSALTAVYADAPLATVNGGVTWNELMNSVGYTAALESALGAYMQRMFNCTFNYSGTPSGTYLCKWPGNESGVVSMASDTIEIYDSYTYAEAVLPLNGVAFPARVYELVTYSNASATYPEATELMTNLGLMNSSAKAWTDPITVDEANALINAAFFVAPFNPYNWSYTDTIPAGDSVTGAQFLHSALSGMGWGTDEVWITYFHLTRGIEGYNASAALSREQAAQIMDNCMKATAGYNTAEIRGCLMGANYNKLSVDGMGRPTYQWVKTSDSSPLSSVYADTPIAVLQGGATWNEISASVGLTAEMEATLFNMGHWSRRMFNYGVWTEGAAPESYGCNWPGQNAGTYYTKGWTIEIYDTYKILGAVFDNNTYESRAYDMMVYSDLIAEVKTIDSAKRLGMYGERHGEPYGWWDVSSYLPLDATADGIYVMHWSGRTSQVNDLTSAATLAGKLTAFDLTAGTAAVDGASKALSDRFNYGRALMTEANLNKHFVFYLDSFGNILGAKLESPSIEVSMTLSQMIGYHFILDLDEAYASATMVFEKNGVTSEPVSGERLADGKYQFTYTMTAKEADDTITATLYYGGDVLTSAVTSGSAYLTAVESTYGADSTYGRIAAAALNYSKAAKIYFQYGSYGSVSLDLSGVSVADQDTYVRFVDSSDPNVTYYGKSFLAKDVTILRIWLRTAAAPEVTVTLDGQPVNGVKVAANALNAGYYCIDIPVAPGNLSKFFHIAVAGAMEFDMGVYDYVKQALSEQSEKTALVDLCKALYAYGEAAK